MANTPTTASALQRLGNWLDKWGLFTCAAFLLGFIPLYPKLPLFDILPGYIVRVRIEDLLVAGTVLLWSFQLYRKKTGWQTVLSPWIFWYAVAGLAAVVSGMFIVQTIPLEFLHVSKSFLHYLRYLEYFSLFFITASSIKTKEHARALISIILAATVAVGVYGIGQKYWYWPVYSTMNREFSKGIRLYLTEHARVQSTFGGHYDLAAYLVVVLPIVLVLAFFARRRWLKLGLWTVFLLGVWLITVSASRTSFAAFVVCTGLAVGLYSLHLKQWRDRARFFVSRGLLTFFVILTFFWSFGEDIRERLLQTLEVYPVIHQPYVALTEQAEQLQSQAAGLLPSTIAPSSPPTNSMSTEEMEALVASDQQPVPVKPDQPQIQERPTDVYIDAPDLVPVATTSATGEPTIIFEERPRVWSDAALKYGLSLAIRLDTLWPRAIEGFYRDPIFGSGYATLTKDSLFHFSEAESTDNNFLRTLGETGLFGFVTFYGAVVLSAWIAWRLAQPGLKTHKPSFVTAFSIGYICATIGLLLNAVYIDVFASSKVAFVYWALAGIVAALWQLDQQQRADIIKKKGK